MSLEEAKRQIEAMPEEARKGFLEAFGEPEDLDPAILPYVEENELGVWVKHPLVYSILHTPLLNAQVNARLKHKREQVKQFEDEERWVAIPYLYERPYRLEAFQDIEQHLSDKEYWNLLAELWTDSENIHQNEEEWRECFLVHREGRLDHLMDEGERLFYDKMPEVLTVHRGYSHDGRAEGLSWTHDLSKANWFAHYLTHKDDEVPRVVTGKVKKEHVIAIFDSRNEFEVVVFPEWVFDRTERRL